MLYLKSTEFFYIRSKNIRESESGETELFIFVGLNLIKKSNQQGSTNKKVKAVFSNVIEIPVDKAPEHYLSIPNGDSRFKVDREEFKALEVLAEEDLDSFILYRTKDVNS